MMTPAENCGTPRKGSLCLLITGGILINLLYFWLGYVLELDYWIKAPIRLFLFTASPILYNLVWLRLPWRDFVRKLLPEKSQRRRLLLTLIIGAGCIAAINLLLLPVCYFLGLSDYIAGVVANTEKTRAFLWAVMFYVPIFNAMGEELFFRACLYAEIARLGRERFAMVFSAALFALYHLSIVRSWFDLPMLLAMQTGLFACGILLNRLIRRDRHLLGVWLIHGLINVLMFSVSLQFVV